MAKKTTLNELGQMLAHVVEHMSTKEDIKCPDACIDGLQLKVDGIRYTLDREAGVRSDQKIPERLAKLEEKVFGRSRA